MAVVHSPPQGVGRCSFLLCADPVHLRQNSLSFHALFRLNSIDIAVYQGTLFVAAGGLHTLACCECSHSSLMKVCELIVGAGSALCILDQLLHLSLHITHLLVYHHMFAFFWYMAQVHDSGG
jgi:hypothetical protein